MAPRPGALAGLLLELAPGGRLGSFLRAVVGEVETAGRDLEQDGADRDPVLAHQGHPTIGVERDDGDRARVTRDVTFRMRAVGALDRVDPEGQVATLVEDLRIDDTLDEIGPGGILRGRGLAVGRWSGQAATWTMSGARVMPVSPSKTWSFSSGRTIVTMSPGRTRCEESTIATMSVSAAFRWSSSSLPRYSTTSARARNEATPGPS